MLGIIFDMDGTLLDTQSIFIDAWDAVGLKHGIENLGAHIRYCCGMSQPAWQKYLLDHFPTLDVKTFSTQMVEYIKENLVLRFKPGAVELMENPALLVAAKEEHAKRVGPAGYIAPIPKDVKPIAMDALRK